MWAHGLCLRRAGQQATYTHRRLGFWFRCRSSERRSVFGNICLVPGSSPHGETLLVVRRGDDDAALLRQVHSADASHRGRARGQDKEQSQTTVLPPGPPVPKRPTAKDYSNRRPPSKSVQQKGTVTYTLHKALSCFHWIINVYSKEIL